MGKIIYADVGKAIGRKGAEDIKVSLLTNIANTVNNVIADTKESR